MQKKITVIGLTDGYSIRYAKLETDLSEDWEGGGLLYASEDWVIGELQDSSLVIGLNEGYSTLG